MYLVAKQMKSFVYKCVSKSFENCHLQALEPCPTAPFRRAGFYIERH